eukprot:6203297-Pleurochrysis_carterae.AAC.1
MMLLMKVMKMMVTALMMMMMMHLRLLAQAKRDGQRNARVQALFAQRPLHAPHRPVAPLLFAGAGGCFALGLPRTLSFS